ncbi:bifunctional biotin--[acetyl-CoA-carboxylase] ligase/biotin operon repressor BirA [Zophobihabitans entericus]|uniref:Bifunctional ligase/repressor BirA n=1 Tax=Zophobihabitans entericus TaxID=1635327 RepID=A0A6G9ID79_9GAMM|nr:bifunctional biotin--[acetyl-CoA-carboxylase] ligase/biotin operon repressor BirA [Zophobihabitans entericus]QIQ21540.1 bifunctional biotin--[acetyl-CoA-carboxylase] ligase/biotin operon repressor BirA [Zophobihabitans entericus]
MRDLTQPLKLIEILSDGQFHSGEELGALFGMSRVAINKHIKTIKEWGIALSSVQGKGYKLDYPLQLLNLQKIADYYPRNKELQLEVIPVIDSTNQYLLNKTQQLSPGDACVAEYQQAGRGRRGRQWFSPFGANLYLSMYWRLEQGPAAAMGLSLMIGIVLAEVLREVSGQDIRVKWPNDLYLNDKKLVGILVEMIGRTGDYAHVVMGMGINLAMHNPDPNIVNQRFENLGNVDRNQLVAKLLQSLRASLVEFEKTGFTPFIQRWNQLDNFLNRPIKLLIGEQVIRGIGRGINEQGALLLEQNGVIKPFIGGEISLRADDS